MPQQPVSEEELHALVDGQLAPGRTQAARRYLEQHPDQASRVAAWAAHREALRASLAHLAEAPLPPKLDLGYLIEQRFRRRGTLWPRAAAAAVVALFLGGAAGWLVHVASPPSRTERAMALLKQEAVATHRVYAPDRRRAVELPGKEREQLSRWLSARLGRDVSPPDLDPIGFHLVGGRLLATERGGAAALFLYETARGDRISVVFRPMAPEFHAERSDLSAGALNGCAWIGGGMGYAIVADLPDSELERAADQIRMERSGTG